MLDDLTVVQLTRLTNLSVCTRYAWALQNFSESTKKESHEMTTPPRMPPGSARITGSDAQRQLQARLKLVEATEVFSQFSGVLPLSAPSHTRGGRTSEHSGKEKEPRTVSCGQRHTFATTDS